MKGLQQMIGGAAVEKRKLGSRCLTWPLVGTAERRDAPAKLLLISAAAIVSSFLVKCLEWV